MPGSLPNYLAGSGPIGEWEPTHLFAGDADVHTDGATAAVDIEIYTVVSFNADGHLIPFDPSAGVTSAVAGIAAQPISAGAKGPYYTAGAFNPDALKWPTDYSTFEARRAVFAGTPIFIKKVI